MGYFFRAVPPLGGGVRKNGDTANFFCPPPPLMLLIHRVDIHPSRIRGPISNNLAAMHGGDGGKPSKCIRVDTYRSAYARFLCRHSIPEFYIPAQHNTKSNTRVGLWRKESDDTAKSALQHAAEGQIPMPEAFDDMMLCLHNGAPVADIVHALDAQYNTTLTAKSYPGDTKCNVVCHRGLTGGKYTNAGLTTTYWIRTIPDCHEGPKMNLRAPSAAPWPPAGVSTCNMPALFLPSYACGLSPT